MSDKHVMIGSMAVIAAGLLFACFALLGSSDSTNLPKAVPSTAQIPPVNRPKSSVEPVAPKPDKQRGKPFEYKILSEEWADSFRGRVVTVKLRTPDDIAPKVTEEDLELLAAAFMKKYKGAAFGAYFYTVTPLVNPWARISHLPWAEEKLEWYINEYAFEFGPWYFPDRLDSNVDWHELVWITLPMANKIVNGATQFNWKLKERDANNVFFESSSTPFGSIKDSMDMDPQSWNISTYDGDASRFVRLVESSLNHLDYEFSQKIVTKLNSVIGNSEYLSREKTWWEWQVDGLEVTYHHYDGKDTLSILKTKP